MVRLSPPWQRCCPLACCGCCPFQLMPKKGILQRLVRPRASQHHGRPMDTPISAGFITSSTSTTETPKKKSLGSTLSIDLRTVRSSLITEEPTAEETREVPGFGKLKTVRSTYWIGFAYPAKTLL